MKLSKLVAKAVAIGLVTAAAWSPAFAQQEKGGLYVYHTQPAGACPGLDWHIYTEPDGMLTGFVAWDQMKHMARLQGMINQDRSFKMNAQETGGTHRKAVVSGSAAGDYIKVMINGSGTACDGKMLNIPRDVGGLQGGGG